jgi:hypothetical protein
MKRSNRVVLAAALAAALAHVSCGSNDPTRVGRPPVVESFSPTGRVLTGFVGDTLQFTIRASDPDSDRLAGSFAVNNHWIADGTTLHFAVDDTGQVSIRGSVSDGSHTAYIDWYVNRRAPVNFPPVIETTLPRAQSHPDHRELDELRRDCP